MKAKTLSYYKQQHVYFIVISNPCCLQEGSGASQLSNTTAVFPMGCIPKHYQHGVPAETSLNCVTDQLVKQMTLSCR